MKWWLECGVVTWSWAEASGFGVRSRRFRLRGGAGLRPLVMSTQFDCHSLLHYTFHFVFHSIVPLHITTPRRHFHFTSRLHITGEVQCRDFWFLNENQLFPRFFGQFERFWTFSLVETHQIVLISFSHDQTSYYNENSHFRDIIYLYNSLRLFYTVCYLPLQTKIPYKTSSGLLLSGFEFVSISKT